MFVVVGKKSDEVNKGIKNLKKRVCSRIVLKKTGICLPVLMDQKKGSVIEDCFNTSPFIIGSSRPLCSIFVVPNP
jgi:hypothetical protein